ncbi:MAG: polymerase, sigma 28 subunit, FliA/WhiG subfamily [Oscillospiraceae bacterium]|nr:polymerase, sigma 28 subunit, FliA/WhiG subfamily [Oscillospiraceae bacterium]
MPEDINELAQKAARDAAVREDLIRQCEGFILRTSSRAAHRFITKSDDEWSVALLAFSDAITGFSPEKGGFFSFAALIISRRMTDYYRMQKKYAGELSVSPYILDGVQPEAEAEEGIAAEVLRHSAVTRDDHTIRDEIDAVNGMISRYGFSFFDLTECSPRQGRTKDSCAVAVNYLLEHPILLAEMRRSGLLPIKALEKSARLPRKILERHRKYIIAAVEILSGDYPALAAYLGSIRRKEVMT